MNNFENTPHERRVTITLAPLAKIRLISLMNKEKLNVNEAITYLINFYYEDELGTLKHFKKIIQNRVKKGINYLYKKELEKIGNIINEIIRLT